MRFGFSTAGESHGPAEVALVHGVPAGLGLLASDVNMDLARRQKGYGRGGRQKIEKDEVEFLGGVQARVYPWLAGRHARSATTTTPTGSIG